MGPLDKTSELDLARKFRFWRGHFAYLLFEKLLEVIAWLLDITAILRDRHL
jgi:hypothetical protein